MNTTSADALLSAYTTSPTLARRLAYFNFCPAEYLHPTRRGQFCPALDIDQIWEAKRARPALSLFILKSLKIEDRTCFEVDHIEWPLALLSLIQLGRLQRYLAATLFSPVIKKILLQEDVSRWRTRLGQEAYKFALTGANLLPCTAWADPIASLSQVEPISSGWIEAALSTAPEPIRLRANLKLPLQTILPHVEAQDAQRLVHALLSILEPAWRSSFSTTRK